VFTKEKNPKIAYKHVWNENVFDSKCVRCGCKIDYEMINNVTSYGIFGITFKPKITFGCISDIENNIKNILE
jgi:hypothetical protein